MTGHNHPPGCLCGWCIGGWRGHAAHSPVVHRKMFRPTFESYVNPVANCPVCGASVYFYQSPYGGRVFDDLGPPWPKHPCTDTYQASNILRGSGVTRAPSRSAAQPSWQVAGLSPVWIEKIDREDGWHVLKCRMLEDERFIRLLSTSSLKGSVQTLAVVSAFSLEGVATLYFWNEAGKSEALVYAYLDHYMRDPSAIA